MPKKKTRKQLVKQLDKVFSEYIRLRDKSCVTCGSTENLTCGHLFSRVSYSTRWNHMNAYCQCWGCNYKHEFDPWPLTKYFLDKHGQSVLDNLHFAYGQPTKYKDYALEEMYEHWRDLVNNIKNNS